MATSNSLIDLGKLSKPANTLIIKISDAIGGIFKPNQIRRVAAAKADADKIKALSKIEITDIQRRAAHRVLLEETRNQCNIEAIAFQALPLLSPSAEPQALHDDWIANFFRQCRDISQGEMQALWAKVLAGEANSPGQFSKRTVNLLADLDKSDAEAFTRLAQFELAIESEFTVRTPFIEHVGVGISRSAGIDRATVLHLDSLGLVHFSESHQQSQGSLGLSATIRYADRRIRITFAKPPPNALGVGQVLYTKAGAQLATVFSINPIPEFLEFVWKRVKGQKSVASLSEIEPS